MSGWQHGTSENFSDAFERRLWMAMYAMKYHGIDYYAVHLRFETPLRSFFRDIAHLRNVGLLLESLRHSKSYRYLGFDPDIDGKRLRREGP